MILISNIAIQVSMDIKDCHALQRWWYIEKLVIGPERRGKKSKEWFQPGNCLIGTTMMTVNVTLRNGGASFLTIQVEPVRSFLSIRTEWQETMGGQERGRLLSTRRISTRQVLKERASRECARMHHTCWKKKHKRSELRLVNLWWCPVNKAPWHLAVNACR